MSTDLYEDIRNLSRALNLEFYEQDWGICNADPERMVEFINYFDRNRETLGKSLGIEMSQLIICSFDDALSSRTSNQKMEGEFIAFLERNKNNEALMFEMEYWIELDETDFPVSKYCKRFRSK